jgi:uncharacterized repeat protein (TIGR02543 family)
VLSITVSNNTSENVEAAGGVSDPSRSGYTFGGWSTVEGGKEKHYSSSAIKEAPSGTVLYAIWNEVNN